MLDKEMENYLYEFIVDTNNEQNLINSIEGNEELKNKFKEYYNMEDDEDE